MDVRAQMRMWLAIQGLLASLFKAILRCCGEEKIESEETGSSNARRQRRVVGKGNRGVTMRQESLPGQGGCPGGFMCRLQYCLREEDLIMQRSESRAQEDQLLIVRTLQTSYRRQGQSVFWPCA